ncbi:MAG: sugar transferase [Cytophagaceae bacterium]
MEVISSRSIAYINGNMEETRDFVNQFRDHFHIHTFENGFRFFEWYKQGGKVNAIVSGGKVNSPNGLLLLHEIKKYNSTNHLPFVFMLDNVIDNQIRNQLIKERVSEIFEKNADKEAVIFRLSYLIDQSLQIREKKVLKAQVTGEYKIPVVKRVFDIVFSLVALIILLPLFLVISVLIKIESRGPVFYSSRRVGTGYRIFNFYKFRSMDPDADKKLVQLAHLNQYGKKKAEANPPLCVDADTKASKISSSENGTEVLIENAVSISGLCDECALKNTCCQSILYMDGKEICEKTFLAEKKEKDAAAFVKISNDPRVTRIGKFIRNTSIDELPQLFNVLKGDMSIVGNRPLPLYEAEKITTDQFIPRFLAPAGITGLWQVTKRGSKEMSEEERIQLDNDYAKNYSFIRDLVIIAKTIPALLQKDNV